MNQRIGMGIAMAILVVSSGCLGILSGPVTFSASKATVSESALTETGYEEARVTSVEIERTFTVAGQSKTVSVTNWIAMYERSISLPVIGTQRAAVFSVISTPEVSILGQSFNPISEYSNREIVKLAQKQYGSLSIGNVVGTRTVQMLGTSTKVTKFEGTATLSGGLTVDVYIHVTKVHDGDDFVVAVAVYPQKLLNEQQRIDTLLTNIQHGNN